MSYFSIHNHTSISNLYTAKDSIITIEKLIKKALELNLSGVCVTEHGIITGHYNAIEFVKEGKEKGDIPSDFTLGLGFEAYVANREETEKAKENNEKIKFHHLIILAKDEIGHRAIRELSSIGFENSFHYKSLMRIPIYYDQLAEISLKYKNHLIVSSACIGGFLGDKGLEYISNPTQENKEVIIDFLNFMYKLFEKDFYIELQPSFQESQVEFNKLALNISKATGIKAIITTDSHFIDNTDKLSHKVFLKSSNSEREVEEFYSTAYMLSTDEIIEYFSDYFSMDTIHELLNNTQEIKTKIKEYSLKDKISIPDANIPDYAELNIFDNCLNDYSYIKKFKESEYPVDRYFLYLIEVGFIKRKREFKEDYLKRIDIELEQIWEISDYLKIRLANYYCLVLEIIEEAWKTSLIGVGRGSSGSFECLYLIGITQISGYDYGLDYWRHISVERKNAGLPDIDTDAENSQKNNILQLLSAKYGEKRILPICTYKTNGPKETILSAFRGLDLLDTDAHYLASLLGSEKSGSWSIKDSYFGNEKKNRKPVKEFVAEVDKYNKYNLLEILLNTEGLEVGRSAHAAAVVLFKEDYNENSCAMMKTNSGQMTTQNDMRVCESAGLIKMDLLVIEALTVMRTCMNMLIEDGLMEWKGSLKDTFEFYLHPDNLIMDNKEMISLLYTEKNMSFFQMESVVGNQALLKVKPRNFYEVCAVNSLMRLTLEGADEQPIDKYIRFRDSNCEEWYKEMIEYGLVEEEMEILKKFLLPTFGICDTQELLMKLSQAISNFDLVQMNIARKSIAKKSGKALEKFKELFYGQGYEFHRRGVFLDYVWKYCFSPNFGYSFSDPHVRSYTMILWQELNLCYRFPIEYYKASVLTVKAGLTDTDKKGSICYDTLSEAIGNMRNEILPPDINKSKKGFAVVDGKILCALISLQGVNEKEAEEIINNRPYNSFKDFLQRCNVSNKAIISLIKCGAFDSLTDDRKCIAMEYIKATTPLLKSLTTVQMESLVENNLLPSELNVYSEINKIRKQVLSKSNLTEAINKTNGYYKITDEFLQILKNCGLAIDYTYTDEGKKVVEKTKFQNAIKKFSEPLTDFLKSESSLLLYNSSILNRVWNEKFSGDKLQWEMDSVRTYFGTDHQLNYFDLSDLSIKNFNNLEEGYKISEYHYKTDLICGTVVGSNKDKHLVNILSADSGVVKCKMSKQHFVQYNHVNSFKNEKGDKVVVEDSYFTNGNLLILQGFKQGGIFYCKEYKHSYMPIFSKILGRNEEGKTIIKFGRENG